jgi:hypothetical protein
MPPALLSSAWALQTRSFEGLVPVKGVQVQVLSPALQSGQEVTAKPGLLPRTFLANRSTFITRSL